MQKNKQMGPAERDKDKQALKLVAGWRRSLKELGLNENNLVQQKISRHFPSNFLQNQDKPATFQSYLEEKIMPFSIDKRG